MLPTPLLIDERTIRVFVTCCDEHGIGRCAYVDVDAHNPLRVLGHSLVPVLDVGQPGQFDDNGVACSCVVRTLSDDVYMYYVGFELCKQIRYRLFTGLAISHDGGTHFERYRSTPILDRSTGESLFRCGPYVECRQSHFDAWYVAGEEWVNVHGKQVPVYGVRCTTSDDGIHWPSRGNTRLDPTKDVHGYGRPWRLGGDSPADTFVLSVRLSATGTSRLATATTDGERWSLDLHDPLLGPSLDGVDDRSASFPATLGVGSALYCFYSGNDFGRAGFAVAVLEQ